jgi:hypothetical protein
MYCLDRLARSLTLLEAVLAPTWKLDGPMFTVDIDEVVCDPDDRGVPRFEIIGVCTLERSSIAARMRAGRRSKGEARTVEPSVGLMRSNTHVDNKATGRRRLAV